MTNVTDEAIIGESWPFEKSGVREFPKKSRALYFASKRVFDLVVSCASLPVFVGLCTAIYMLNIFGNPGPLFFTQVRMGKDQRKFVMLKFRTMLPEEKAGKRGPFDKLEDWRITPLGRWMRKTRLDEVPQLLNVIMGQMSLIGPRPEKFEFAQTYQKQIPGYHVRTFVRPGITGYAQVKQGYTDSEEAIRVKTELDTFYIRNMSWWLDLKVLFRTVFVVARFYGAR